MKLALTVNGQSRDIDVPPNTSLLSVLRDDLGLTGTRYGCGRGQCGACYVLADGAELHPVQQAFVDADALQCGYCTSGMIISATALLARDPEPDETSIRDALAGNLCRCGVYGRAIRAIQRVAGSS